VVTPSDLATITGAVTYAASVITHLGILKFTNRKGTTVSVLDDLKAVVSKLEGANSDVVDKVTSLSSNPATSGLVSAVTEAAKTDLPAPVYDALAGLVGVLKDLAGTPATSGSGVASAGTGGSGESGSCVGNVPVPATPAASPAPAPSTPTAAELSTVPIPAETLAAAPKAVQSPAALMGLPQ
jgi:hypothetical protein